MVGMWKKKSDNYLLEPSIHHTSLVSASRKEKRGKATRLKGTKKDGAEATKGSGVLLV